MCAYLIASQTFQAPGGSIRFGESSEQSTRDPISNSTVKTLSAYDTSSQDVGKSVLAIPYRPSRGFLFVINTLIPSQSSISTPPTAHIS